MSNVRNIRFRGVLIAILILVQGIIVVADQAKSPTSKFLPPKGKTLVAVGSANPEAYTKATGHTPLGHKFFCGLKGEGDVAHFEQNARNVAEDGFLVIGFALDPAFPKQSPKDADKLTPFLRGEMDGGIEAMGRAIKKWGRPVFAALGYEFDGQHPHQPREYAAVFRRIHDTWDRLGVANVVYVWHSFTDNLSSPDAKLNKTEAQLYEFYPGDNYVDWFGVSVYYETQRQGAVRFARMAKAKDKPLALIESGVGVNPNKFWDYSWDGYYAPLFKTAEQLDAKLLCYNNFGDDYNQFSEPGNPFRNTQMDRMPREVRSGWGRMMKTARFRSALLSVAPKPDNTGRGATQETPPSGDLLFNGKDLAWWTAYFRDGIAKIEEEFTVTASGNLILNGRHPGYLVTKQSFHDFVLSLEWRFPEEGKRSGAGSGVLLALGKDDGWFTQGFECQIAEGATGEFWLYEGSSINGKSAGPEQRVRVSRRSGNEKPIGKWNTYEIRCEGRKITVRLNDKLVNEGTSDRPIGGRIGLVSQGAEVEFREIRLMPTGK